jgi:ABC-type bacteriocin/lantibiotic exporter with double-glycine peptidase domain
LKNLFKKIFNIVPSNWNSKIFTILLLTLFNAVFELIGIGLLIPLLTVFTENGNTNFSNFEIFNTLSDQEKILSILIVFIIVYILKNFFFVLFQQKKINFSHDLATNLSQNLHSNYLKKNYIFFTLKNSSQILRNIIDECNIFSFGVIISVINLLSDTVIFISIFIFLLIYNPIVSLVSTLTALLIGFIIIFTQQVKLKTWGAKRQYHSEKRIKLIQETYGNIKEIIISNTKNFFLDQFYKHTSENAFAGKKKDFYYILPKSILEVIAVIMIFILVYILMISNYDFQEILITMGVLSMATIKIIPSIANIIKSIQGLKFNTPVVNLIHSELNESFNDNYQNNLNNKNSKKLNFKKIVLKDINYNYPNNSLKVLEDINLTINKGDKIGIVGETGSGKTTLINLLVGLINPTKGEIMIDGVNLQSTINDWHNKIAYISQDTFLADESIIFNISIKDIGKKIDIEKINKIIKLLSLDSLISSLKDGLNTNVGEKGVKLSGGQIQRIGIARAIYGNPEVLFLDEATNALDEKTKDMILKNIYNFYEDRTLITIAHDKETLDFCQKIYTIRNKKLEIVR